MVSRAAGRTVVVGRFLFIWWVDKPHAFHFPFLVAHPIHYLHVFSFFLILLLPSCGLDQRPISRVCPFPLQRAPFICIARRLQQPFLSSSTCVELHLPTPRGILSPQQSIPFIFVKYTTKSSDRVAIEVQHLFLQYIDYTIIRGKDHFFN